MPPNPLTLIPPMSKPIQSATLTLPKLTRKRVWLGAYGGHWDTLVMFAKKPTHWNEGAGQYAGSDTAGTRQELDCLAEQEASNIVGDMCLCDFQDMFPGLDLSAILTDGRPRAIEIVKGDLLRVELWLPLDQYGTARSIDMHADWR